MANGDWNRCTPRFFGRSRQLSLHKFYDPSTPSLRKVDDGGKKWGGGIIVMSFIVATTHIEVYMPVQSLGCCLVGISRPRSFLILRALIFGAEQLLQEASCAMKGTNKWICACFHMLCMSEIVSDVARHHMT